MKLYVDYQKNYILILRKTRKKKKAFSIINEFKLGLENLLKNEIPDFPLKFS